MTIDALYAITNCEINISPNCCVIVDNTPEFISVTKLLKLTADYYMTIFKGELEYLEHSFVSKDIKMIGDNKKVKHNKYTTKVNVDLMGNSGTVLDGTSKWDNDTQGISYSSGNVGIGILNPSEKLSISDNVRIDGAEFKDGLLSIHLYKEEPKKETPRKIPIKS